MRPVDRVVWSALQKLHKSEKKGENHVSLFVYSQVLMKLCRYASGRIESQAHASRKGSGPIVVAAYG
jgi:hypothetical protein